jgi:hypothetical protein
MKLFRQSPFFLREYSLESFAVKVEHEVHRRQSGDNAAELLGGINKGTHFVYSFSLFPKIATQNARKKRN